MRFGSLFAGIGGFDLGLERAGMECAWQVEREPYAVKVLEKHWPCVRRHDDVCTFPPTRGDWSVDLICGGFPCQDISIAGKGLGLAGERSGLWNEFARIVGELRPSYVIVENVAAILARGMATVLSDLSEIGYDAEWHVIPASAAGAPHRRERVWIVAYANSLRKLQQEGCVQQKRRRACNSSGKSHAAHAVSESDAMRRNSAAVPTTLAARRCNARRSERDCGPGCEEVARQSSGDAADANFAGFQEQRQPEPVSTKHATAECGSWWKVEPDVGRVAHGIPSRVDRLRCLGNAVVPQVVEIIGKAIIEFDEATR